MRSARAGEFRGLHLRRRRVPAPRSSTASLPSSAPATMSPRSSSSALVGLHLGAGRGCLSPAPAINSPVAARRNPDLPRLHGAEGGRHRHRSHRSRRSPVSSRTCRLGLPPPRAPSSLVGDWLTRALTRPCSACRMICATTESGMLFGQYLVEASTRFEITDPAPRRKLKRALASLRLLRHSARALRLGGPLRRTSDLWAFIKCEHLAGAELRLRRREQHKALSSAAATVRGQPARRRSHRGRRPRAAVVRREARERRRIRRPRSRSSQPPCRSPTTTSPALSLERGADHPAKCAVERAFAAGSRQFAARTDATAAAQDFALARAEEERRTTYAALGELAGPHAADAPKPLRGVHLRRVPRSCSCC